jgi:hypothetical protein
MTARALVRLLVLALFAGSALTLSASRADASTCWNTGCDGRWPDETSCNNDGFTLISADIPVQVAGSENGGGWMSGGTLAVMFSPSCRSQWTLIYAPNCPTGSGGLVCPNYLDIVRPAQSSYPYLKLAGFRANGPWYWGAMVGADTARATSKGCASVVGSPNSVCVSRSA